MRALATLSAIFAALFSGPIHADVVPIEVAAIEVRLFLADSGQLSEPITEDSELWNTIIGEGEATKPSTSTLVKVLVTGPRGGYDREAAVTVTIIKVNSQAKPTVQRKALGVFSSKGKQYVAFWLENTGCEELQVTARIGTARKVVGQRIPFHCGE